MYNNFIQENQFENVICKVAAILSDILISQNTVIKNKSNVLSSFNV